MRRGYGVIINRRVIINLKSADGKAIDGVLVGHAGPVLLVKGATLLRAGHEPVSMDGEVVVDRENIDFIQAV